MNVLDSLKTLLHKMVPSATAGDVLDALNKIAEAEGSQAASAQDVATAIQRISDAYTPPVPPTPTFEGMYVLYVLAHPSWTPNPDIPSEGAGLDVEITLMRFAEEYPGIRKWVDSVIEQPKDIVMEVPLTGFSGHVLSDLPVVVVSAVYGDSVSPLVSAMTWPPTPEESTPTWQTEYTSYIGYQQSGNARMRVGLGFDSDADQYICSIDAEVRQPVG